MTAVLVIAAGVFPYTLSVSKAFSAALPAELSVRISASPLGEVVTGRRITYTTTVNNSGQDYASQVKITTALPIGVRFVSCTIESPYYQSSCAAGSNNSVVANINTLPTDPNYFVTFSVVADVLREPGGIITATSAVTGEFTDTNSANNSASVSTEVIPDQLFTDVKAISGGGRHTLALKTDGSVWAWGDNSVGQLGNTVYEENQIAPAPAIGLTDVSSISSKYDHTLALKTDGTLWAWGANSSGQLGNGVYGANPVSDPVRVLGVTDVKNFAVGRFHSIALRSDGTVWTWGANAHGQLGIGSQPDSNLHTTPLKVNGLTDVVAVAAGEVHSVALRHDGTVWTWGNSSSGLFGDGSGQNMIVPNRTTPGQVPGLTNVIAIACGNSNTVALRGDGTVWIWGRHIIGYGMSNDSYSPVQKSGLTDIKAIACGGNHHLALKSDGTVWAWGWNRSGQVGDGTVIDRGSPAQIEGLTGVTAISAGADHSVALLSDKTIRTWGWNLSGQLGDGSESSRSTPTAVTALTSVARPRFDPDGGYFQEITRVRITCATLGADIHYTTNGREPQQTDPLINSGDTVSLDKDTTLRARAWKRGQIASSNKWASYTISIPPPAYLQFETREVSISESERVVPITITRTGHPYSIVNVSYATNDPTELFNCNPASTGHPSGVASSRCDYATTVGRIFFAGNETRKTIFVALTDDVFVEGTERFSLSLRNPGIGFLGELTTITVSITDNDDAASNALNPIGNNSFFVRQHYLDFFGRSPAESEVQTWTGALQPDCAVEYAGECYDRLWVSGKGFFESAEFQQKGYFVYRFYKLFGRDRVPKYNEFIPDMVSLLGTGNSQKNQFAQYFIARADFQAVYPNTMTNQEFANLLITQTELPLNTQQIVSDLTSRTKTRAQIIREVVEHPVMQSREFTESWVVMQYFGYLRRDGAASEYNAWKTYLDANPTKWRQMINGFVNSIEYRQRFGQP